MQLIPKNLQFLWKLAFFSGVVDVESVKSMGPSKNQEIPKKWKYLRAQPLPFYKRAPQGGGCRSDLNEWIAGIRVGSRLFFVEIFVDNEIWYEPVHIEKLSKMNDNQSSPSPTRCIVVHPGGAIFLNLIFDPKFSNHFAFANLCEPRPSKFRCFTSVILWFETRQKSMLLKKGPAKFIFTFHSWVVRQYYVICIAHP